MSIWDDLKKPFDDEDIEWRTSRCGMKGDKPWAVLVPYLNARAIMSRLDEVVGPDGWKDEYREVASNDAKGLICRLTIRCGANGGCQDWIYKEDGAGFSDIESIKGGFSDALKRTAVKFGMGRFLYDLPEVMVFADQIHDGYPPKNTPHVSIVSTKDNLRAWCVPPKVSEIMTGGDRGGKIDSPKKGIEPTSPLDAARKSSQVAYKAVKASGLFETADLSKMKAEGEKNWDDLPSLLDLTSQWKKELARAEVIRDEELSKMNTGEIDNSKIPFGDKT